MLNIDKYWIIQGVRVVSGLSQATFKCINLKPKNQSNYHFYECLQNKIEIILSNGEKWRK